ARPSAVAQVPSATPAPTTSDTPESTVEPTAPPTPTPVPTPTPGPPPDPAPRPPPHPGPDAAPRPGAAARATRLAGRRQAASDRGDDRRPRRGAAAVRPVVRLGRLASPGGRRDPALHGDLPGQPAQGDRPGPQLPLLLHRLGRRVAR